jgi:hypothetical protein
MLKEKVMPATQPIDIGFPETGDLHLKLSVGGCKLAVKPGTGPAWVSGVYRDPTGNVPIKTALDGNTLDIRQDVQFGSWPTKWDAPTLELTLGTGKPYTLTIENGASESEFDLGGLPIAWLVIKAGAGKIGFDFSAPNPQPMTLLDLDAGVGALNLHHLANANFSEMTVNTGAGKFLFDFGGTLQRDAHAHLDVAMAALELSVPSSVPTKVKAETNLSGFSVGDGFMTREGALWNQAAVAGKTPTLLISARATMSSFELRST